MKSADGFELAVTEVGERGGPTVLLVHGYPDNQTLWRHVVPLLAERFHVVAYDVRGAGESDAPRRAAAYDFERLIDDCLAVAAAVSPDRPVHLVGHDWGALQGWAIVTSPRAAGRIASYTAVSGVYLDHVGSLLRRRLAHPTPANLAAAAGQLWKSWYIYLFSVPGVSEVATRAVRSPRARDAANGTWLYRRNMARRLTVPRPTRPAHAPVQLIVPDRDPFISPRSHDGLEALVPQGLRRQAAPGSHWVPIEHPEALAGWVAAFAGDVEAGRPVVPGPGPGVRRPLPARRPRFDWSASPLHWVPGDPTTTHVINVLHLLLPAGEKWFCDVFRQALPDVTDDRLRADVKGFIGQESVHSRAHAAVLDHLEANGLDPGGATRRVEWLIDRVLATRPLPQQLALVAAFEHITCVLGTWALTGAGALDRAGADPVMLDLLRWHGAEEVEHRTVAFELHQHLGGRNAYLRRLAALAAVAPGLTVLWDNLTRYLVAHDPLRPGARHSVRHYARAARQGRLPFWELVAAVPRYARPSHHPSTEGCGDVADAYLAELALPAA